jgi:cobalamin biosynthesis Mg chelatase CobN
MTDPNLTAPEAVARMLERLDAEDIPQRPAWQRDQEFIAWAREAVPALAARVAELEAHAEAVKRAHIVSIESLLAEHSRAEAAEAQLAARDVEIAKLRGALMDIADPKRLPSHGDPVVLRDRACAALQGEPT